jgi:pyruvate/2-oxoglutarate dehydrogenase complex dihydrolipoamide dehydrogenase (E3) component
VDQIYDLVIIGAGSAGLSAAGFAVKLVRKVALVEKHLVGGDCTWTGCVPSKTLLKVARVAHQMRQANRYGVTPVEPAVDLKQVMTHVRSVIDQVYETESPEALRAAGVDVYLGQARFIDPHTIAVGDLELTTRRVLIGTGARSFIPPIDGIDSIQYLTYETVWDLEALPQHLIVVGGGPIGCELAQALGRLGSGVTLLESSPRLLPNDEPESSELVSKSLAEDGVDVRLNSTVQQVSQLGAEIRVAAGATEIVGDKLLLAVGRRPTVAGLDLEVAGVDYWDQGIVVNDYLRTSQRHIYAAGDCTGDFQFTHYAGFQGFMAVRNALLPGATRSVLDWVPWATFTDPEVAHVGLTEAQGRERFGNRIEVCNWPMERVDRALCEGETSGFIKIVHQPNGAILGVTIVNGRAGEMIHEWTVAMDQGIKLGELVNSIHIYPTYSMASQQAALHVRVGELLTGTSGRIIRALARLMP